MQKNIMLIIEDMESNEIILSELFSNTYNIIKAENEEEALRIVVDNRKNIAVILWNMDKFAQSHGGVPFEFGSIPIIGIISERAKQDTFAGCEAKVTDIIERPFRAETVKKRVDNAVALYTYKAELKEKEKYSMLAELSGEIIFSYSVESDFLVLEGSRVRQFFGRDYIENCKVTLQGENPIHPDDVKKICKLYRYGHDRKDYIHFEIRIRTKDGRYEWFEVQAHAMQICNEYNECTDYIGKITNIHKQAMEKERLRMEACTDNLTGLYNHKTASGIIKRYLKEGESGALIFLDLDNFKLVNDNLGHSVGNEILRYVGCELKESFRSTDVVARFGGDEFVVFIKEFHSVEALQRKLEKLLVDIGAMNFPTNMERKVYTSIGVSCYPKDGDNYHELFVKADKALYLSKKRGKNQITFYEAHLEWDERDKICSDI